MRELIRNKSYEERRELIFSRQAARRKKDEMKRRGFWLLLAVIAFAFIFKIASINGKAQGAKEQKYKYYTSIEIEYGDTLWSIAGEYLDEEHYTRNSYVKEIKSINHLRDENEIVAGQMLIIPYYSNEFVKN